MRQFFLYVLILVFLPGCPALSEDEKKTKEEKEEVLKKAVTEFVPKYSTPEEMVVEWWGNSEYCRHKKMKIDLSDYGKEGVLNQKMKKQDIVGIHALKFDLSDLKQGTKIYHASLRVFAPVEPARTDKRAYMNIGQGSFLP